MEGIKDIQDVQEFIVAGINGIVRSLEDDGVIKGNDYLNFGGAAVKLPEAIIGFGNTGKQWADLDDQEREELKRGWDGIDLKDDEIEAELENALGDAMSLGSRLTKIAQLVKAKKEVEGEGTDNQDDPGTTAQA